MSTSLIYVLVIVVAAASAASRMLGIPGSGQPATIWARFLIAGGRRRALALPFTLATAPEPFPAGPPPQAPTSPTPTHSPPTGRDDPLFKYRAIRGPAARIQWWERARAAILLVLLVAALGAVASILVAGLFVALSIALETAV